MGADGGNSVKARARTLVSRSGFASFRYREYRYFWLAAAFSNVGMWALVYGRLWLMHELTDSTLMVGLVTTASLGPVLLFSMWGGVVADRMNRLKLVRVTRAMFSLLAILTAVLIAAGVVQPWHIIAISVGTGVLLSFDIPSRSAMLPALVPQEQLGGAIALYSLVFGGAAILGPALFSPLVGLWGIEGVFFIVGGAYILTVGALAFMEEGLHRPEARPSTLFQGLVDGLRYVRGQRVIASVIVLGLTVSLLGSSFQTLLPVFADKVVTGGIDTYGRLLLAAGVGGLATTGAIALLGARARSARFLILAGIGYGLGLLVLSGMGWFTGVLLAVGFIGAFHVVFITMDTILIQTLAANEYLGRVMSLQQFTWGATALGALIMGALGETLGVRGTLALGGVGIAAATGLLATTILRRVSAGNTEVSGQPVASGGQD